MPKKRTPFRPPQNKKVAPVKEELPEPSTRRRRISDIESADADDLPRTKRPRTSSVAKEQEAIPPSFAPTEKLQKILAQSGVGSRRDMEEAIAMGRVSVNGQPATIGQRVTLADRILIDNKPIRKPKPDDLPRILLYHKPEGEIVSHDDPERRTSVFEKLPRVRGGKWISVGRLDYNTSGLLIFTTSGELANRLTHPRFEVEREYAVRVVGELTKEQGAMLCKGVKLDDGVAKFEWLREEGGSDEATNRWYRVMLREGRNREVRRMFESINVMVSRLMRVRFGIINLPTRLKRGALLELDEKQTKEILSWVDMPIPNVQRAPARKTARVQMPKEKRPMPRNKMAGRTQKGIKEGKK